MSRLSSATRHMVLRILALVGIGFLLLSVYFFVRAVGLARLSSQPLSLPLSLTAGTFQTPTFKADFSQDYQIDVQFQPKVMEGEIYSLINISWRLQEGRKTVAEGSSERGDFKYGSEHANGKILRTIGVFRAQKGHRYSLILHINRDATKLNVADPTLAVHLPYSYNNDLAMGEGFNQAFALDSLLLGLFLIIPAVHRRLAVSVSKPSTDARRSHTHG